MTKPTWDQYFISIAEAVATRSPDPKYKVGAVVVSKENRILGTGYNGFISKFNEDDIDWSNRDTIRPYIIHAEMNAILHSKTNLNNATLYVTLSPCKECIKLIAAAKITKIIYKHPYKDVEFVTNFCNNNHIALLQAT